MISAAVQNMGEHDSYPLAPSMTLIPAQGGIRRSAPQFRSDLPNYLSHRLCERPGHPLAPYRGDGSMLWSLPAVTPGVCCERDRQAKHPLWQGLIESSDTTARVPAAACKTYIKCAVETRLPTSFGDFRIRA